MTKLILITLALVLSGCSTTKIEHATIEKATFNTATWKSQAGVGADATIEATTSPKTDASLGAL